MTIKILLISDIHGNYPALQAIDRELNAATFDYIINSGDSLVYAPFPNETINWLKKYKAISILGNTDQKVIDFFSGRPVKKPKNPEKRVMYTTTSDDLNSTGRSYLLSLAIKQKLKLFPAVSSAKGKKIKLGIFHGSPADHNEFLFADTKNERFHELATLTDCQIVITGHSHTPYHKLLSDTHFINPGSAGRMFDSDPRASCAILEISIHGIIVQHFRIAYDIGEVVSKIKQNNLPEIYATMYREGKKLN